jgi:hypothetical protein
MTISAIIMFSICFQALLGKQWQAHIIERIQHAKQRCLIGQLTAQGCDCDFSFILKWNGVHATQTIRPAFI